MSYISQCYNSMNSNTVNLSALGLDLQQMSLQISFTYSKTFNMATSSETQAEGLIIHTPGLLRAST